MDTIDNMYNLLWKSRRWSFSQQQKKKKNQAEKTETEQRFNRQISRRNGSAQTGTFQRAKNPQMSA